MDAYNIVYKNPGVDRLESKELIIFSSAVIGGLITLLATYFNNKASRYELEYNYRKEMDGRFLLNAQKHLDDVYLVIYKALIEFNQSLNDHQELETKVGTLKNLKKNLDGNGLTAFLTPEIEFKFNYFMDFLTNSLDSNEIKYGIITRYRFKGIEKTDKGIIEGIKPGIRVSIFKIIFKLYSYMFSKLVLFRSFGFEKVEIEIVLLSAPIDSIKFELEVSNHIDDLKGEIKSIALGTK